MQPISPRAVPCLCLIDELVIVERLVRRGVYVLSSQACTVNMSQIVCAITPLTLVAALPEVPNRPATALWSAVNSVIASVDEFTVQCWHEPPLVRFHEASQIYMSNL
jgi:hypothetical protein